VQHQLSQTFRKLTDYRTDRIHVLPATTKKSRKMICMANVGTTAQNPEALTQQSIGNTNKTACQSTRLRHHAAWNPNVLDPVFFAQANYNF